MEKIKLEATKLCSKGYQYAYKGDNEKAMDFYQQSIDLYPKGHGYLYMGILKNKLKQYDKAIENFNMYIENTSESKSTGYGYRGSTKLELGLLSEAFDDFMLAIKIKIEQKYAEQDILNDFYKEFETYKKIKSNIKKTKFVSLNRINKKINKCFSDCISCIDYGSSKKAIEYLQKLLQMYPKPVNPENIAKNKEN